MAYLEPGVAAPDFVLDSDRGRKVRLSGFRGKPVVLYFYPKDDTLGCTKEACGFRDHFSSVESAGAVVLGVSPDDAGSHRAFVEKYDLPFELLVDEGHEVADLYGAWGTKNMYGKVFEGILRTTYVIDAAGNVAKVFKQVKVDGHVEKVLDVVKGLA